MTFRRQSLVFAVSMTLTNATQATEPRVRYAASAGCPTEEEFVRDLQALRSASTTPIADSVDVVVMQLQTGAVARVRFVDDRGNQSVRELSAKDCREVVSATALVVTLALDSKNRATPDAAPVAPPPQEPASKLVTEPVRDRTRPRSSARSFAWQAGVGAVLELTIAPEPLVGPDAFLGLGGAGSLWDVRGHFLYLSTGVVSEAEQKAEFGLIGGRLDGCALPLLRSPAFVVHPCIGIEVGSLETRGVETERYSAESQKNLRVAAGPLVRGRAEVGQLAVEAYGGPWISVVGSRRFFFREPAGESTFYEAPAVGWVIGAGLAVLADLSVISRDPTPY